MKFARLLGLCLCIAPSLLAARGDRIIVKWRDAGVAEMRIPTLAGRAARLAARAGQPLSGVRSTYSRADVLKLSRPLSQEGMRALLARLRADPSVQYAHEDELRYISALPNDPRFYPGTDANGQWEGQWYLRDPSPAAPSAIGATTAWDRATGTGLIIAVVDTGVRLDHPDLGRASASGIFLPGRDFVCNDDPNTACLAAAVQFYTANDGDSWDADPSDPGDWISAADLSGASTPNNPGLFAGCGDGAGNNQPTDSTWHGTRVSGLIAARTNNALGVAGVAPGVKVLPVRALGKCAGYLSDIVDGMYWAAGFTTTNLNGVPANPNAAHIVNLSLGSNSACTALEQEAVSALVNDGVVVVAAAGNSGGPIQAPANCTGAIAVSALRHVGTKVGFGAVSSPTRAITIGAPAGNCINITAGLPCLFSIETTSNEGRTVPAADTYTYSLLNAGYAGNPGNAANVGTSFSAPMVAAVAAMMVQINPNLTVPKLIERLQSSATPFPTSVSTTPPPASVCHVAQSANDLQLSECYCTTATCGAGMLNAPAALLAAERPIAEFTASRGTASVGDRVTLDASGSRAAAGRSISAYSWSASPSVAIANATQANAEFVFPALRPITITLSITDSTGATDSTSLVVNSVTGIDPDDSGGGGAIDLLALLALAALAIAAPLALALGKRKRHQ